MPKVSGVVVEKWTRRPIRGVTVKIGHYTALTDAMGHFSIESPIGTQQMRITHRDFHPAIRVLHVLRAADIGVISLDSKVFAL